LTTDTAATNAAPVALRPPAEWLRGPFEDPEKYMNEAAAAAAGAAPTTAPAATAPPASPAAPATSQQAAARLAELRETPEWSAKVLASDPSALREFHQLSRMASQVDADPIDIVMSGEAAALPNNSYNGQPSIAAVAREIPALREAGISDGAIRELLSGHVPSSEEIDAVSRFKTMCFSDPEWVQKYLAGDFEARREATTMSIVLMMKPAT
jgi:hypothetical protein